MKKILSLLAIVFLMSQFVISNTQAENIIYGGGQFVLKAGTTNEYGGGTLFGYGQQVGNLIFWGQWEEFKTGEGTAVNNGLIGTTFLTDTFLFSSKLGFYLTVEGGLGKVEGQPMDFASLTSFGSYYKLSQTMNLWLGGGYSITGNVAVYSVQAGLSFYPE